MLPGRPEDRATGISDIGLHLGSHNHRRSRSSVVGGRNVRSRSAIAKGARRSDKVEGLLSNPVRSRNCSPTARSPRPDSNGRDLQAVGRTKILTVEDGRIWQVVMPELHLPTLRSGAIFTEPYHHVIGVMTAFGAHWITSER